jgi:hypothetical protein
MLLNNLTNRTVGYVPFFRTVYAKLLLLMLYPSDLQYALIIVALLSGCLALLDRDITSDRRS